MPQDRNPKPSKPASLPSTDGRITQADVNTVVDDRDVTDDSRENWLKRALARLQQEANPGAEQRRLVRDVRDIIQTDKSRGIKSNRA